VHLDAIRSQLLDRLEGVKRWRVWEAPLKYSVDLQQACDAVRRAKRC